MIKVDIYIHCGRFFMHQLGLLLRYFTNLLNSHYAFNNLEIVF